MLLCDEFNTKTQRCEIALSFACFFYSFLRYICQKLTKIIAMRLGQLARKLAVSPTELINFLTANNIQTTEGSNTRLTDDQVSIVLKKFDPAGLIELKAKQIVAEEAETIVAAFVQEENPSVQEENIVVEAEPVSSEILLVESAEETAREEAKVEVIKAQKVELSGLKVLGKIELPQPKKKETETEQTISSEETLPLEPKRQPRQEGRKNYPQKKDRYTSEKNPIALQREREAGEAEKKRQAQAKLEKEKRTQHYLKKVKISVPTKPARLLDEQVVEMVDDQTTTPTTWLGKFWKWFRS